MRDATFVSISSRRVSLYFSRLSHLASFVSTQLPSVEVGDPLSDAVDTTVGE